LGRSGGCAKPLDLARKLDPATERLRIAASPLDLTADRLAVIQLEYDPPRFCVRHAAIVTRAVRVRIDNGYQSFGEVAGATRRDRR
jgi:hypothetical protein